MDISTDGQASGITQTRQRWRGGDDPPPVPRRPPEVSSRHAPHGDHAIRTGGGNGRASDCVVIRSDVHPDAGRRSALAVASVPNMHSIGHGATA